MAVNRPLRTDQFLEIGKPLKEQDNDNPWNYSMIEYIRNRLLLPIPEGDEEHALEIRIFNSVCMSVAALLVVAGIGVGFVFVWTTGSLASLLGLSLLLFLALKIARRGNIRLAAALLVYGLWATITLNIWLSGTVNTVFIGVYVAIIVMASIMLGSRFGLIMGGLSLVSCFALTVAQDLGYSLPTRYPMPPWSTWFVFLFTIAMIVPMIHGILSAFAEAASHANKEIETRRRTEEILRASESKYRFLAENASDVIWTVDMNFRTTFVSPSIKGALGFTPEERMSQTVEEQLTPQCLQRVRERLAKELIVEAEQGHEEGAPTIVDLDYIHKDGSVVCLQTALTFIRDDEGIPIGLYGISRDVTELKRSQEALRESEKRYRRIVETAREGVWSLDNSFQTTFVNQQIASLLGYTPEEMLGKNVRDFVFEKDMASAEKRMGDFEQGRSESFRTRFKRKDGEGVWMQVSATAITDEADHFVGSFAMLTDISEQKKAEQELKRNLAQKQAILDGISSNVAFVNENLEIQWANKAAASSVGKTPCEMVGHTCHSFWADPDKPCDDCPTAKAFKTKKSEHATIVSPDGRVWDERGEPVFGEDGRLIGVVEVALDISESLEAEAALRTSEERYRTLFDSSPVGIISIDREGNILEVNQMLLDIVGSPSPEATKAINVFQAPELIGAGATEVFRSCVQTGERIHREMPYTSRWGKHTYVRIVLTPMKFQDGTIIGCQAIVEDFTQQRALECQLRHGQKMEAIGTLAGGIAHDFNNLLHIISGNAELLESELASRRIDSVEIAAIRQASERGAELVKQIGMFSRRVDTKFELIDLNEEILRTERLLHRTIPKMIEIDLRLKRELRSIVADSNQIEQMLVNLALNAQDAMPKGGKLTIETDEVTLDGASFGPTSEEVNGDYVCLKVSDTGHGIEENVMGRIFEPFFTTKGLADATGLGLSTVFGIVKMHEGHLVCESEVGNGTTFIAYFPVSDAVAKDSDKKLVSPDVSGGPETVLVVDDEPFIADLAKRILEGAGYSVITANSGKEALETYSQRSDIALVILDLIMPEMSGENCLMELLKIDPGVKAIIASGFAIKGSTKTYFDREARARIAKPFNMKELLRTVRSIIDGP